MLPGKEGFVPCRLVQTRFRTSSLRSFAGTLGYILRRFGCVLNYGVGIAPDPDKIVYYSVRPLRDEPDLFVEELLDGWRFSVGILLPVSCESRLPVYLRSVPCVTRALPDSARPAVLQDGSSTEPAARSFRCSIFAITEELLGPVV